MILSRTSLLGQVQENCRMKYMKDTSQGLCLNEAKLEFSDRKGASDLGHRYHKKNNHKEETSECQCSPSFLLLIQ